MDPDNIVLTSLQKSLEKLASQLRALSPEERDELCRSSVAVYALLRELKSFDDLTKQAKFKTNIADSTGLFDKNGCELFVGDIVRNDWGYDLEIRRNATGYFCSRLICDDQHPCKHMSYAITPRELTKIKS